MVFLTMEQDVAAARRAMDILSKHPNWARVQERLANENLRQLRESPASGDLGSRRVAVLKNLDFQAGTYLELVTDAESAEAYCTVLRLIVREAYARYCGWLPELAKPLVEETRTFEREIELHFQEWTVKAYAQAGVKPAAEQAGSAESSSNPGAAQPIAVQQAKAAQSSPAIVTNQRRRRGPEADFETAYRLAKVVDEIATSESWRTKLDDVCEALDEQEIPYPKKWSRQGYLGWSECAVGSRDLAVKAIEYRLRQAKKRSQASS